MNTIAAKEHARLIARLAELPQRPFINDVDADAWVDSVISREPERADWHIDRLFGIGGSEIGTLLAADDGLFHPFSTARDITAAKLLSKTLEPANGDMARGTACEPMARDLYRAMVAARGGHPREDLLAAIAAADNDPDHPWLIGNPDDIVEENGKVYIIDYKVPMPDQIAHYDDTGVPFYYAAQLHHYRAIATRLGIHIDGLRLGSMNFKAWNIDERDIPYDQNLHDRIMASGDRYWNDYVLKGRLAPTITVKNTVSLEEATLEVSQPLASHDYSMVELDATNHAVVGAPVSRDASALRKQLGTLANYFGTWSLLMKVGEQMRGVISQVAAETLPIHAMPYNETMTSRIDAGIARISVTRAFKENLLLDAIRNLMRTPDANGVPLYDDAAIETVLNDPNYWSRPTYAADRLVEAVKDALGVDVTADPRFDAAIATPSTRRTDTLVALLSSLDVDRKVDIAAMVDPSASRVSLEMAREPLSGPRCDLKHETMRKMRTAVADLVASTAITYPAARAALIPHREPRRRTARRIKQ